MSIRVLRGVTQSLPLTAGSALLLFVAACSKPAPKEEAKPVDSSGAAATAAPAADATLTAGFIYVGPKDDYGYNQAHAEAAKSVAQMPGVKVTEQASVEETAAVQEVMETMIRKDGAKLLFPTSFGYFDPHILKVAAKHPEVTFYHCGGLYQEGKHPKNVGSYFGYIGEAQYVAGIAAGLTTKTKKLGFIAAKPIPQVLRNINSFHLGARSVNPAVETYVVFTGDWSQPTKEAEGAESLVNQGIDVLTSHVDSPKVVMETAEKRGIFSSGYHANQAALAPKGYLTGAEWNWQKVYSDYIEATKKGTMMPNLVRGGFKEGYIKMSAYGPAVSEDAKKKADAAKAALTEGTLVIFKGPLKDNTGKEVIPAGTELKTTDIALESMGYLVEGVKGKVN